MRAGTNQLVDYLIKENNEKYVPASYKDLTGKTSGTCCSDT